MDETTAAQTPGWYEDDYRVVRWWNGADWDIGAPDTGFAGGVPPGPAAYGPPPQYGPTAQYGAPAYVGPPGYAYPAPARSDGRTMAMLAHFGAFVGGFILPLVILLTTGKDDPFVRHHAAEALNFQLTYFIFAFVGILLSIITLGFGLILFFPLFFIAVILHIVWAIMGAVAANRGEWWRYPVNIRMVKGAI